MEEKQLIVDTSPHIRKKENISYIMWWVVVALLPAAIMGVYQFGTNALWIVLVSVAAAVLTEFFIQEITKQRITIKDGSAVITGLLLALVLPPTVPLWIPIVGSFIAISIAKHAFGGIGQNIFNPALIGRAFLVASWPLLMTTWLAPDGITAATPLGALKVGGELIATNSQLFLGSIGGTIGETSALAVLLGAFFLFIKKIISWRIPLVYIGTVFLLTWVTGQDPVFHILAGGLMLGAFFMATDYVTTPITKNGRVVFGIGLGILTVIIRLYSGLPEGVMYSILLMNGLTPLIDRHTKPKAFGAKK
jgi:electron transport complex protein RnfD|tara:strand:+ start:936 stop:1853 length:918 start_codon:yes stop_codon:yes gene_type:complete